ncbi:MAG TPA: hypothetical protein VKV05_12025 [Terriglobales bacterium]|nr:hypothetical protein [Terriglobales bacterium]
MLRGDALRVGTAIIYASLVAVLVERIIAVASDLQLWGDGAWFLIKIASSRNYYLWIGDWKRELFRSRLFTILAEQTPAVIGTHLRIHSLHVLSLIFGVTLYSHALLSLYLCHRYAPRRWYMLFPLLSFFAGTMNVEAYLSTDSHFVVSLYWPLLFILLFREELTAGTTLLLIALSIPTILSYESMMFFGIILAAVCLWRWKRLPHQRALMAALAVWYVAGAALAAAAVIWPFDPSNRTGFFHAIFWLMGSSHLAAKISLVVLLCCSVLLVLPSRLPIQKLTFAVGLLGLLYLYFAVFVGHTPSSLDVEVQARVLNLLLPLAATALLLLVLVGWSRPDARAIGLAAVLIGGLGFGQVFWNLAAINRWQGMLATLCYELQSHEGPLPYQDSILSSPQLGPLHLGELDPNWSLSPLSLYETGRGEVRTIIVPEPNTYLPFDPYALAALPDLSRYRIRYDFYREALEHEWQYRLGETLTFTRGGSAAQYLRGNWANAEDWATWGSGPEFGLDLPLTEKEIPETVLLSATVAPNLAPNFPDLSVEVRVNNVPVGTWSFRYSPSAITTRSVQIPKAVLAAANPVQIRFHVLGPVHSPAEMGKGPDPRKLSLAFLKLALTGEQ